MTFYDIEMKSRELREKIRNTKPELDIKGTTYYVSAEGDDNNDGLSPETAWKTYDGPNNHAKDIKPGDAVLFRCGDIIRPAAVRANGLIMRPGVTYSSFGEGKKPDLRADVCDGAELDWKYEGDNIYSVEIEHTRDIGNIVFNNGQEYGYKLSKGIDGDTTPLLDLDFYHDVEGKKLYLCSEKGNPANRWKNIDIGPFTCIFKSLDDERPSGTVVDGLSFKYTGGYGISFGTVDYLPGGVLRCYEFKDFTVRNCEFEWIGGALAGNPEKSNTRLGNGIEIWGGGDNIKIYNCYFNQCYDAAFTHQFQGGKMSNGIPVSVTNSVFSGNLFENNTYDYEYFVSEFEVVDGVRQRKMDSDWCFKNVFFENNICRKNGYGFGNQRPDRGTPACVKSWGAHCNKSENFVIRNNIFDRSDYCLLELFASAGDEYSPTLDSNTYCQYLNKGWIRKVRGKAGSVFNGNTIKDPTANYAEANAITVTPKR